MERRFAKPSLIVRVISVLMAILLVVTLVPKNISFANDANQQESLDGRIAKMVSLPHAEGEVIVGFKSGISQDELQTQTDATFAGYEKIITVDAGEGTPSNSDFSVQSDIDQIDIAVIRSSDQSTSQLLKNFLQDKDVVFAEPNYLIDQSESSSSQAFKKEQAQRIEAQAKKIASEQAVNKNENVKSALTTTQPVSGTAEEAKNATEDKSGKATQDMQSTILKDKDTKSTPGLNSDGKNDVAVMAEQQTGLLGKIGTAADSSGKKSVAYDKVLDLTPYQWALSPQTVTRSSVIKQGSPVTINSPNFDAQTSNMDRKIKVAVIDSGVDYTHPDLSGKVYRFSEEEQQALGCGEWGYCARPNAPQDAAHIAPGDHGTHCAGIIGAAWDGRGISGAASDAVIVNVLNGTTDGLKMGVDTFLRSFAFVDAFNNRCTSPEDKILVTSNSYGGSDTSIALNTLIYAIGKRHETISIFAAGNEHLNNDTSGLIANALSYNPYKVIVAASNQAGDLSDFSNWGKTLVDVASPGVSILSTVPATTSLKYYPDAVSNNVFYEGFEDDESSVVIEGCSFKNFDVVQLKSAITPANTIQAAGSHSLGVKLDSRIFDYEENLYEPDYKQEGLASFYMKLQLSDAQVKKLISMKNPTLGFAFETKTPAAQIMVSGLSDGKVVELESSIASSSTGGWNYAQVDLKGVDITKAKTIALKVAMTAAPDAREVYFDSIGIGNEFIPYETYDGTSMACPLVAGGAAILAAKYPNESGEARAARVIASVSKKSGLKDLIASGGVFDMTEEKSGTPVQIPQTKLGSKIYENNLGYYNKKTTDDDELFELQSYEQGGQMLQYGNAILRAVTSEVLPLKDNSNSYFATLKYRWFDLDSREWIDNATITMPEPLSDATACIYNDQLFVLGNRLGKDDLGNPAYVRDAAVLYVYNFKAKQWSAAVEVQDVVTANRKHLIATDEGVVLIAFGNIKGDRGHTAFYRFSDDVTSLERDPYAVLDYGFYEAGIGVKDNVIYCYDVYEPDTMYLVSPDKVELIENIVLPKSFAYTDRAQIVNPYEDSDDETDDESSEKTSARLEMIPLLVGQDGIYIVGYDAENQAADTWVLYNDSYEFEPYERRLSKSPVFSPTAVMKDGEIFAMGYASLEPEKIIFRSTQAENPSSSSSAEKPEKNVSDSGKVKSAKNGSGDRVMASAASTPKTGDSLMIASVIAFVSFVVLSVLFVKRRRVHK